MKKNKNRLFKLAYAKGIPQCCLLTQTFERKQTKFFSFLWFLTFKNILRRHCGSPRRMLWTVLFTLLAISSIHPFSPWTDYQLHEDFKNKDFDAVKDVLQEKQIENPGDPKINYNLGTVFYNLKQWQDAKNSFERAVENIARENELKERAYFNLGNSFYKNCLEMLGQDWEKKELKKEELDAAIAEVSGAIEKYEKVLVINSENKPAKDNKMLAEELLRKLRKKRQDQEDQKQNQQQDKQDQKDKQKQDKDQQKQDDQQQGGDDKKGQQDQKQQNKKDQKQQNGKDDQQQKDKERQDQEKQDKQQRDKKDQEDKNDEKDKRDQEKAEQDQKQDEQKEQEDKQKDEKEEKGEEQQMLTNISEQRDASESMEEKGLRALLDSLQNDESKLQKKLLKQKSAGKGDRLDRGQKPW